VPLDELLPSFPDIPEEVMPLQMDEFGSELINKVNKEFANTGGEIKDVDKLTIYHRMAVISTLYKDRALKSAKVWPITPLQSERLIWVGNIPNDKSKEDLALVIYGANDSNEPNCEKTSLVEGVRAHARGLGLDNDDFKYPLLIVNPGAKVDASLESGILPVILPGLTQVYPHKTLLWGGTHRFRYGLENGLPARNTLSGDRILSVPSHMDTRPVYLLSRLGNSRLYVNLAVFFEGFSTIEKITLAKQEGA